MKSFIKRGMSGLLAFLMCFTALFGAGSTTAFAASETSESYMISFPRDGDANQVYGTDTWGHPAKNFMNGWYTEENTTWTVHAQESFEGQVCYCIEPGVHREIGDTYSGFGENFWDNYPSSYNNTIEPDTIKVLLGRIMQYGYQGNVSTGWRSQNDADADKLAHDMATQILVWETVIGERDAEFNHVDTGGKDTAKSCIAPGNPLYSRFCTYYFELSDGALSLNGIRLGVEFDEYMRDLLEYGLGKYDVDFDDAKPDETFHLWAKYRKEQVQQLLLNNPKDIMVGTKIYDGVAYAYICIDLKSYYASVECVHRHLDPLKANLLVADESRSDQTICLAVSPSLKAKGVPSRPRLFEAKQKIREYEAMHYTKIDYIIAVPRMAEYERISAQIYGIYLHYVAPEDIHVYSIDECFIDCTAYLHAYERKDHITKAEKALLRNAARNFQSGHIAVGIDPLGLADYGVEIHLDDLSKKEILSYIDEVNFNTKT